MNSLDIRLAVPYSYPSSIIRDLTVIVRSVLDLVKPEGILLVGGFGRGEGSILKVRGEEPEPLNDYDVLVLMKDTEPADALKALGHRLAKELGIDFVDVGVKFVDELRYLPCTIENYDMKYGSTILYGDPTLKERIPNFRVDDIPVSEATRLLFNRIAGVLGGFDEFSFLASEVGSPGSFYMRNQLVKAFIGMADAHLLLNGYYHHLYRTRKERLLQDVELQSFFDRDELELVLVSYDMKLSPQPVTDFEFLKRSLRRLAPLFQRILQITLLRELNMAQGPLRELLERYAMQSLRLSPLRKRIFPFVPSFLPFPFALTKQAVYSCLAVTLFSAPFCDGGSFRFGDYAWLRRWSEFKEFIRNGVNKENWGAQNRLAVALWEQHCH